MSDAVQRISKHTYRFNADTSLLMVENIIGMDLPSGRANQTLGAYVLDILENIPKNGETLRVGRFRLTVDRIHRNRIRSITLEILPVSETEA